MHSFRPVRVMNYGLAYCMYVCWAELTVFQGFAGVSTGDCSQKVTGWGLEGREVEQGGCLLAGKL